MKELEKSISKNLKELEKMINNKNVKKEIE